MWASQGLLRGGHGDAMPSLGWEEGWENVGQLFRNNAHGVMTAAATR